MCRGKTALLVSFYILSDLWALVIYLPWNGTRRGTSRDSPFEQRPHAWHVLTCFQGWLLPTHMLPCLSLKPSILCWNTIISFLWFSIPKTQPPGGLKSNLYSKASSSAVHYYWGWIHKDFKTTSRRQVIIYNTLEGLKHNYHIHSWSFRAFYL